MKRLPLDSTRYRTTSLTAARFPVVVLSISAKYFSSQCLFFGPFNCIFIVVGVFFSSSPPTETWDYGVGVGVLGGGGGMSGGGLGGVCGVARHTLYV